MVRPMKRTLGLALALLISAPQWAQAAAISGVFHEPFPYAPGTLFPNGPAAGTPNAGRGWNLTGDQTLPNTSAWGTGNQNNGVAAGTFRTAQTPGLTLTYNAGGLPTGYFPPSGNRLNLDALTPNPTASQSNSRNLGGQTVDAGSFYFSLIVRRENDTTRSMNFAFFNAANNERMGVGQIGAAVSGAATGSNGNIAFIFNNQNTAAGRRESTVAMGTGIAHLIIGRVDFDPTAPAALETITMWVDPLDVTTEAAALPGQFYTGKEFDIGAINYVRPFVGNQATITTPAAGTLPAVNGNYDELRFGSTWAAVTTQATIPEPGSFALLALGSLVLGAFRKKA